MSGPSEIPPRKRASPRRLLILCLVLVLAVGGLGYLAYHRFWGQGVRPRLTLKGHTDRVTSVAFTTDGKILASCSYDGTVRVWDTATGKQKAVLNASRVNSGSCQFSAQGGTA